MQCSSTNQIRMLKVANVYTRFIKNDEAYVCINCQDVFRVILREITLLY